MQLVKRLHIGLSTQTQQDDGYDGSGNRLLRAEMVHYNAVPLSDLGLGTWASEKVNHDSKPENHGVPPP